MNLDEALAVARYLESDDRLWDRQAFDEAWKVIERYAVEAIKRLANQQQGKVTDD